jgi:hypothetical protein
MIVLHFASIDDLLTTANVPWRFCRPRSGRLPGQMPIQMIENMPLVALRINGPLRLSIQDAITGKASDPVAFF